MSVAESHREAMRRILALIAADPHKEEILHLSFEELEQRYIPKVKKCLRREEETLWFQKLVEHKIGKDKRLLHSMVAHRGFHCTNDDTTTRPLENTMAAYEMAWVAGLRYAECDIAATSDGKCVLLHDSDFARVSMVDGLIKVHHGYQINDNEKRMEKALQDLINVTDDPRTDPSTAPKSNESQTKNDFADDITDTKATNKKDKRASFKENTEVKTWVELQDEVDEMIGAQDRFMATRSSKLVKRHSLAAIDKNSEKNSDKNKLTELDQIDECGEIRRKFFQRILTDKKTDSVTRKAVWNKNKPISELTYRDIMRQRLKGGAREPLLSEVLSSAGILQDGRNNIHPKLVIEIKAQEIVDDPENTLIQGNKYDSIGRSGLVRDSERTVSALIDLLEQHPEFVDRIGVIMSFDREIMHEVVKRFIVRVLPKMYKTDDDIPKDIAGLIKFYNHMIIRDADSSVINTKHTAGLVRDKRKSYYRHASFSQDDKSDDLAAKLAHKPGIHGMGRPYFLLLMNEPSSIATEEQLETGIYPTAEEDVSVMDWDELLKQGYTDYLYRTRLLVDPITPEWLVDYGPIGDMNYLHDLFESIYSDDESIFEENFGLEYIEDVCGASSNFSKERNGTDEFRLDSVSSGTPSEKSLRQKKSKQEVIKHFRKRLLGEGSIAMPGNIFRREVSPTEMVDYESKLLNPVLDHQDRGAVTPNRVSPQRSKEPPLLGGNGGMDNEAGVDTDTDRIAATLERVDFNHSVVLEAVQITAGGTKSMMSGNSGMREMRKQMNVTGRDTSASDRFAASASLLKKGFSNNLLGDVNMDVKSRLRQSVQLSAAKWSAKKNDRSPQHQEKDLVSPSELTTAAGCRNVTSSGSPTATRASTDGASVNQSYGSLSRTSSPTGEAREGATGKLKTQISDPLENIALDGVYLEWTPKLQEEQYRDVICSLTSQIVCGCWQYANTPGADCISEASRLVHDLGFRFVNTDVVRGEIEK